MEPPSIVPPDKDNRDKYLTQSVVNTSNIQQQQQQQHNQQQQQQLQTTIGVSTTTGQQTIEKLSRPMAFDKMECVVKEMQDSEAGVPVRSQKLFLTSIPSAFMGYDLIEWLMERLTIEESEALNIANQLCLHGYFFPVNDSKTLVVKDDSSLYRFQTPYYWPWQHKAPDNVEYAIYLAKRSLRNKQRHGLEEYETEALANLHKNLKGKWDFITMQAEEQVKLAKERKKGDKIVGDSQERAYWRVHRPPPGQFTPLEPCPVPSRDRQGKPRRRTVDDWSREVEILTTSLGRTRMKMSQACECLVNYCETFAEYDPMIQPALPSNPWVSEDLTFWQLNHTIVDIPTEKRVRRWAISIEEIVSDPTGLHEFTVYLKKEYSHENIRFWLAVNDLRRSSHSLIPKKVKEIYEEFLAPGAPCEINIDGKTMENVQQGLKSPSRFAFDAAAEHIYALLLKKDCYPRFIRSEHYKSLVASGIQPSHKKRFFGFGGVAKKKSTTTAPNPALLAQATGAGSSSSGGHLARRRGSDRSLSGSAHELAVSGVKDNSKVPHSHSQSNLSDIPYRGDMPTGLPMEYPIVVVNPISSTGRLEAIEQIQEGSKSFTDNLETTIESGSCVCPWDDNTEIVTTNVSVSVCPWDDDDVTTTTTTSQLPPTIITKSTTIVTISPTIITIPTTLVTVATTSSATIPKVQSSIIIETGNSSSSTPKGTTTATDLCDVSERMRRSCGLRQNTLDCDFHSTKRLMPTVVEHRRASVTVAPKISDIQFANRQNFNLSAGGGGGSGGICGGSGSGTEKKGILSLSPILQDAVDTNKITIGRAISFEDKDLYSILKPNNKTQTQTNTDESLIKTIQNNDELIKIKQIQIINNNQQQQQQQLQQQKIKQNNETMIIDDNNKLLLNNDNKINSSCCLKTIKCSSNLPLTEVNKLKSNNNNNNNNSKVFSSTNINNSNNSNNNNSKNNNSNNKNNSGGCVNSTTTETTKVTTEKTSVITCIIEPVIIHHSPGTCLPPIIIPVIEVCPIETTTTTTTTTTTSTSSSVDEDKDEDDDVDVEQQTSEQTTSGIVIVEPQILFTLNEGDVGDEDDDDDDDDDDDENVCGGDVDDDTVIVKELIENKMKYFVEEPQMTDDLSPTTEEYQEGMMPFQQMLPDQPDCDDFDLATGGVCILTPGCVAPAPTPAPSVAPLAEVEIDPPDDDLGDLDVKQDEMKQGCESHEEHKKRKKKKEKSIEDKTLDEIGGQTAATKQPNEQTNRFAVCPWEDEDVATVDATPFVKTYSTLGYL